MSTTENKPTRTPSPAKGTLDALRENGFIDADNAITLVSQTDATVVLRVPLERFVGIRPNLINGTSITIDKILAELQKLKEAGKLTEFISQLK